jgi:hypothetical protein
MRQVLANDVRTLRKARSQERHSTIDAAVTKIQSHLRHVDRLERRSADV